MEPNELTRQQWDAVIIGTGMGGATLGYALARVGKKVLFCEKGKSSLRDAHALRGAHAETFSRSVKSAEPNHKETLSRAGRWCDEIEDNTGSRPRRFVPLMGSGTGGSTALYGMALERLFPADFSPRQHHDEATDCNLPERWAVGYDELTPYYAAAERLYRVRGTIDPLRHEKDFSHLEPPPLSPVNQELWDHLAGKGLHPYRLPMACEFVPGCEGCQGYLCANNCKNNSTNICLEPAVNQYGAELLDECNVTKLEANGHEVTAVRGDYRGEKLVLRGRVIVLAAGALATPDLLLRSTSRHWPNGLANESGWVGRNLMRHHIDLYAVFPTHREKLSGNVKEIAFNDFYINGRQKLGSVQSFGYLPETDVIAADIEQDIRNGALPWAIFPFKLVRPVLKAQLARTRSKVIVLATILEDLPYSENMILPRLSDREPLSLKYRIRDYDRLRIELFRKEVRRVLKPYRVMLIKQAEKNKMLAHVAGTCRFGVDPTDSVVDANNRAHGLSNLYVADASFFPSSGGTNPALTIAANALRVADVLLAEGKC